MDVLLSPRERQVRSLLLDGLSTKEIAGRLNLSPKTVSSQTFSLYRKLNIHSRAELFALSDKASADLNERVSRLERWMDSVREATTVD